MGAVLPILGPLLTGVGGIASLFGAGKGKKAEYSQVGGKDTEDYTKWIMEQLKKRAQQPRRIAMPNMMQKNAMGGVMDMYGMPGKAQMFKPQMFDPTTGGMVPPSGPGMPNGLPRPGRPPGMPPGGPRPRMPMGGQPGMPPQMRDPRMMRRF